MIARIALAALVTTAVAVAGGTVSTTHIVAHFDVTSGQQPENVTVAPDGTAYLTFSYARQIASVTPAGRVRVLATLPAPDKPATPRLGRAFIGGIARDDRGTTYVTYATGTPDLTGIWALPRGGTARRIVALPADGLPNGLALDQHTGLLYVTDSVQGVIYRVPSSGGVATVWAADAALRPTAFAGANGLKLHHGAAWVTSFDNGTILRIPFTACGDAGAIQVRATGMPGLDDFAFTGRGDTLIAARVADNEVDLVRDDGTHTTLLTAADGVQNPTSVAVNGSTVDIASAAYFTNADPNLLTVHLDH